MSDEVPNWFTDLSHDELIDKVDRLLTVGLEEIEGLKVLAEVNRRARVVEVDHA